jgi:hypothetical protein
MYWRTPAIADAPSGVREVCRIFQDIHLRALADINHCA